MPAAKSQATKVRVSRAWQGRLVTAINKLEGGTAIYYLLPIERRALLHCRDLAQAAYTRKPAGSEDE